VFDFDFFNLLSSKVSEMKVIFHFRSPARNASPARIATRSAAGWRIEAGGSNNNKRFNTPLILSV